MFTLHDSIFTSSVLELPRVRHAFSTRLGGVSTDSATRSMNVAPGHGDTPEQIYENISILAGRVGVRAEDTVCTHQIHSSLVCYAGDGMRGRGVVSENPEECDGFYTDVPGVALMVRTADCAPILLGGLRADGTPAVCALHAGWRGSCAAIAWYGCAALGCLGVEAADIFAAVGPCAHAERFEVGEDMRDTAASSMGADFAARHIVTRGGRLFADVPGMNREVLLMSGVPENHIDISDRCTISEPELFHSHRATGGRRGAMGNIIVISPTGENKILSKRGINMNCPNCGSQNSDSSKFCIHCGHALPVRADTEHTAQESGTISEAERVSAPSEVVADRAGRRRTKFPPFP